MRRASAIYFLLTLTVFAAILASRRPARAALAAKAVEQVSLDDMIPSPEMSALFLEYNKKYFRGRLPVVPVFWSRHLLDEEDLMGWTLPAGHGRFVILLNKRMLDNGFENTSIATMLHESCHVAVFPKGMEHGPAFEKCMESLAARHVFAGIW